MTLQRTTLLLALALCFAFVTVTVSRASAHYQDKAFVLGCGEVNKPGKIPFTEGMTVRHALVLFEGMTAKAEASRAVVLGKDGRHITVDPTEMNGTNSEVELQAGDVIAVPSLDKPHFFAMGAVNTPGVFDFTEGLTLKQAVALFKGPTPTASLGRTFIVRKDALTGRQKVIPTNLGAVMRGEIEDVPILIDDFIFIREFGVGAKP